MVKQEPLSALPSFLLDDPTWIRAEAIMTSSRMPSAQNYSFWAMDPRKRSALTAALSDPTRDSLGQGDARSASKVDTFSFPCINELSISEKDGSYRMANKPVEMASGLAGSAPSVPRLSSSLLDYDLNPFNLRSGREMLPLSLRKDARLSSNFLTEAVIGSLPKAMSREAKEEILASTPLSPTLNLLNSMPLSLVSSRSLEGKRLRRHVLRGAVIVFITAGYSGKRFIFERAKELGVRSIVIDGPESWSITMEHEGVIERFIPLDMSDVETVFDRCLYEIGRAKKDFGELDGIVSFSEMAMPLVSRLSEKLGLPGNPPSAVDAARDKHVTRARMFEAGLPTPKNFLIEDSNQLKEASAAVGFPAVIKPIYGAASIGVVRVDSEDELQKAYSRVTKELASARVVAGALEQGDMSDGAGQGGKASAWFRTSIMMEEYLDGPEVDVDLVFSEGQAVYGAVTDNWPTIEPYFLETGSNAPSILPLSHQKELLDLAVRTVQCLGFVSGVFHVEGKYTTRGPRLIEVNCRMGGGPVRTMNQLVWGVDLVEEQLLCSVGIPSKPAVSSKPLMCIAEYSTNAMRSGILRDVSFLEPYQNLPNVLYARPLAQPGSRVTGAKDGLPSWICELMVTLPTIQEAIDYVKKIEDEIQAAMVIE